MIEAPHWLRLFRPADGWSTGGPIRDWLRNSGLILIASFVERSAALIQTILIARAIGVADYGRYALLLGTIGAMTPFISLMLPSALVPAISRWADKSPNRAGAILFVTERISWTLSILLFLAVLFTPDSLSIWLLGTREYGVAVLLAMLILSLSVIGGVGEAVLQAKQEFRALSVIRMGNAIFGFLLLMAVIIIAPALNHIMAAVTLAVVQRTAFMLFYSRQHRRALVHRTGIGPALQKAGVIWHIAIPISLLTLAQGGAVWVGSYMLSRTPAGFAELAVINTGVQWRLPVMLVLTALSATALPLLAAMVGAGKRQESWRLTRYNIGLNLLLALCFCPVAILCSDLILSAYGPEFVAQNKLFALSLVAVVPMVYYNAYQQAVLAEGRVWRELLLLAPYFAILVGGTWWMGSAITGVSFAYLQLAGWLVVAALITRAMLRWRPKGTEDTPARQGPENSTNFIR